MVFERSFLELDAGSRPFRQSRQGRRQRRIGRQARKRLSRFASGFARAALALEQLGQLESRRDEAGIASEGEAVGYLGLTDPPELAQDRGFERGGKGGRGLSFGCAFGEGERPLELAAPAVVEGELNQGVRLMGRRLEHRVQERQPLLLSAEAKQLDRAAH
jgi:hypothetical protein